MDEQAVESNDTLTSLVDAAEPTLSEGEFFLSEGIKGVGDQPEWYKADKYKSVAEQAKAYTELILSHQKSKKCWPQWVYFLQMQQTTIERRQP